MTINPTRAQPEDIVAKLLGQASEILNAQHAPTGESAINYARACAEVANAYAARASAISAAKTAEAAQATVGILTQLQRALGAMEEDFRAFTRRSGG
ncbi:hypothetical protein [Mycolicibacterium alvei]|uniref:Uncharacterized protein n=1 Tax=Mycolicibacterium alvei TaxID=67081 RepID=A0A6N4V367_9MYCO|nr:hypothetical protein [Mycolicibacterium alvei]MCV7003503.1 hypothetical protein [Mycolicibacterium alvei]BBX30543.1 hypothetical protein MALV_56680 [Mycolicibacterium alvei]